MKALVGNVVCAFVLMLAAITAIGCLPFVLVPKLFEK